MKQYKGVDLVKLAIDLDNINKASDNYNVVYAVYLIKLQEDLDEVIQRNLELKGFCNLPGATVDIDVGSAKPLNRRQYRIEFTLQKVVDEQVKKWLDTAVIVLSRDHSAWNNPLLVVPKRNAAGDVTGWRVCIDPRPLNLLIPEVNYPLPLIKDIFEAFKGCKVFSMIDLKGGFHQFKVNEKHQEVTTFTWRGKQYRFQGAPFGFKHLPAVF
jgi:hypothetical protein